METAARRTFASFSVRNFRLYFFGQGVSLSGTWMQTIAMSWLVLQLTHSGTQLGLVVAAQFLPVLLFGAWGGVVADRYVKRRILYVTQSTAGLLALVLGLLVVTHSIQVWMVYALAAGLGLSQVADSPTRQSFVIEMVGPKLLRNAVTLNSTLTNVARIVGPSIAGVLIVTVGIGPCFLINSATYVAVLSALLFMRDKELHSQPPVERQSGQIRAGLRYVRQTPRLRSTLLMMFIIGTFTYEFPVILPLFATVTLHGNAATYSAMTAAMGLGAIVGALYTAGRSAPSQRQLIQAALMFGLSLLVAAIMPTLFSVLVVLVFVGLVLVLFIALGNTTLQLTSRSSMRGRVMSFWSIAFLGSTPIGGPIIGAIADHTNPRVGLLVGGGAAILAAGLGAIVGRSKT